MTLCSHTAAPYIRSSYSGHQVALGRDADESNVPHLEQNAQA